MDVTEEMKILKSLNVFSAVFNLGMMDYLAKEKEIKELMTTVDHETTLSKVTPNNKEEFSFSMYGVYATYKLKL